ncbi:T9SS type A sorting domain-containing protein [Bacteroides sp. OttesenSCG-928-N06]|nr:T9SS type A sorting domain-containing protein [Bacteroides sp. OttesenSCG-928-N06]
MKQKIHFLLICLLFPVCMFAQLTHQHNAMHPGDEIVKQQVVYKNPGKAGTDRFWDFSELSPVNTEYTVNYALPAIVDDSLYIMGRDTLTLEQFPLVGTEHYTMYYFLHHNDSLLQLGHENPNTQLQYTKPMLAMKYPFNYGQVLVSDYESKGLYSGTIDIHTRGTIRVEADAFGKMLIPDGDTLTVMRVKTTQLITELNDRADSINTHTNRVMETFRWYSKGYRYPVFESMRSVQLGDSISQFNISFYFPPQEHYYLENDPENLAVLDSLWDVRERGRNGNDDPNNVLLPTLRVTTYPNPVESELFVELDFMETTSSFIILFYTMQGEVVQSIRRTGNYNGIYKETIDCYTLPSGHYLMKVIVEDQIVTKKIVKK